MKQIDIVHLIWACIGGVYVAILYSFYSKAVLGKTVTALIEAGATNEERAVSLDSIRRNNFFVRFALRKNSVFSRTVLSATKDEETCYYIPEETVDKARSKYRDLGASLPVTVGLMVLLFAVGVALAYAIPWVLDALSDYFEEVKSRF